MAASQQQNANYDLCSAALGLCNSCIDVLERCRDLWAGNERLRLLLELSLVHNTGFANCDVFSTLILKWVVFASCELGNIISLSSCHRDIFEASQKCRPFDVEQQTTDYIMLKPTAFFQLSIVSLEKELGASTEFESDEDNFCKNGKGEKRKKRANDMEMEVSEKTWAKGTEDVPQLLHKLTKCWRELSV